MKFGSIIAKVLSKEYVNVNSAALFLGATSLLSMFISLLREKLIVSALGRSLELDLYYASFKLPDLLYSFAIAFVSAFVIIPLLSKKENKEAELFIDSLLRAFLISALFLSFLAYLLTPFYLEHFFPNLYRSAFKDSFVFLSKLLLLQFIFLSASQILLSFLQYKQKFVAYALAPILYNLGIIFGAIFLLPSFGLKGLGYGVLLGAALHLLLSALSAKIHFRPFSSIDWLSVWEMLKHSFPRAASLFMQQLLLLVIFAYLSRVSEGAISSFQIALTLQSAPYSIIALSYSVAAFPSLAKLYSSGQVDKFRDKVGRALALVFVFSLFATLPLLLIKEDLINLIFGSKDFAWKDVLSVSQVFTYLLLALIPQSFVILITRVFYAAHDTLRPLMVHFVSVLSFILLLKFIEFLALRSFGGLGFVSLAYLLNIVITSALLFYLLYLKHKVKFFQLSDFELKLLLSSFFAFVLTFYVKLYFFDVSPVTVAVSLLRAFEIVLIYVVAFLLLAFVLKLEFRKLLRILKP